MRHRWIAVFISVSIASAAGAAGGNEDTRAVMRRAYTALSRLLPAALAPEPMVEGNANGELSAAVESLAEAAAQIESHARPSDAGFRFLGRSLASDAVLIRRRMATERFDDAGMLVVRMTENCIACHSRLPAQREPVFAAGLVTSVDRGGLSPVHRARLEIALRQFDRALDIHERLLADPQVQPAALDFSGALADYLTVALRVSGAPERARASLQKFARRSDLSQTLERALPIWIEALSSLAPEIEKPPTLERAGDILERGEALRRYPADRADLVHKIVASGMLYRYVQGEKVPQDSLAEAFYLLGISDAFLRRSFERSEAQFYLEQAIRLEPGSDLAQVAFAELETQTLLAYSGSSGLHLPGDVQRWLAQLKAIARSAPPSAP
jgi:tetratricopeptide (TPR) repeat protein